jgi:hypothetical protein
MAILLTNIRVQQLLVAATLKSFGGYIQTTANGIHARAQRLHKVVTLIFFSGYSLTAARGMGTLFFVRIKKVAYGKTKVEISYLEFYFFFKM